MRVVSFAGPDGPRLGVVEGPSAATLCPGDVVAMGTPAGVGMGRTPPLWMKPGDVVEVEIEGIGALVNRVEDEGP
jgi:2-keto-4-pentenoate hydratase/2-oxohepta-3-ene-1,7-dioic acid hydratase in catechol pathway